MSRRIQKGFLDYVRYSLVPDYARNDRKEFMIIKLKKDLSDHVLSLLLQKLDSQKAKYQFSKEKNTMVIMKHTNGIIDEIVKQGITEEVIPVKNPYVLATRNKHQDKTLIKLKNGTIIGGHDIVIMSGPCAVESEGQINESARLLKLAGGTVLRGGAFKPRTSPYDFQGLGEDGLKFIRRAADNNQLAVITEVVDPRNVELVEKYTDIFQVGTRNMYNYTLLTELGKSRKPVLLKRAMSATYKEFLMAAEYILAGGNSRVILCERGIRTFVTETRWSMDINAIPYLKKESHLPVVADPSHATGIATMVKDVALASIAAGADGLLIEAHPEPNHAMTDKDQAIDFKTLEEIIVKSKKIAEIVRV